jgi:hypothetical protein
VPAPAQDVVEERGIPAQAQRIGGQLLGSRALSASVNGDHDQASVLDPGEALGHRPSLRSGWRRGSPEARDAGDQLPSHLLSQSRVPPDELTDREVHYLLHPASDAVGLLQEPLPLTGPGANRRRRSESAADKQDLTNPGSRGHEDFEISVR